MKSVKVSIYGIAALALLTTGCVREPESALVKKLESGGAGDLKQASSKAIESWFREHKQVAVSTDAECRSMRSSAAAGWNDTTEGRVCQAARNVAMFVYERRESSGQKYRTGWR